MSGKTAPIPAGSNPVVHQERLTIAFDWKHDPLFRPMVGAYVGGRLRRLVPTGRRRAGNGTWRCVFSIDLSPEMRDAPDLVLACFETGEILYSRAEPQLNPGLLSVADVIRAGRAHASNFSYGGFEAFLFHPLADQIDILYYDILGRHADVHGLQEYTRRITAGEQSILDVRDEMLRSEEALKILERMTLDERRGRWCLWSGLTESVGRLAKAGLPPVGLIEAMTVSLDLGDVLAQMAMGRTGDTRLLRSWIDDHAGLVKHVERRIRESRNTAAVPETRHYRLADLLPQIQLGGAAQRTKQGKVQWNSREAEGMMFFGPYTRLPPGRHAFSCRLNAAPLDAEVHLQFDVVYENIVFARRDLYLKSPGAHAVELSFTVPVDDDGWFDGARFEFRLHVSGSADVEVEAIALDVHADRALVAARAPSFGNMLPALAKGPAGMRTDDGTIEASAAGGCVFYGPYCFLVPGQYSFVLVCDVANPSDPDVELEVTAARDFRLAHTHSVLKAGRNTLELRFSIPEAQNAAALAGPLEFRLHKKSGGGFACVRATLERADKV